MTNEERGMKLAAAVILIYFFIRTFKSSAKRSGTTYYTKVNGLFEFNYISLHMSFLNSRNGQMVVGFYFKTPRILHQTKSHGYFSLFKLFS